MGRTDTSGGPDRTSEAQDDIDAATIEVSLLAMSLGVVPITPTSLQPAVEAVSTASAAATAIGSARLDDPEGMGAGPAADPVATLEVPPGQQADSAEGTGDLAALDHAARPADRAEAPRASIPTGPAVQQRDVAAPAVSGLEQQPQLPEDVPQASAAVETPRAGGSASDATQDASVTALENAPNVDAALRSGPADGELGRPGDIVIRRPTRRMDGVIHSEGTESTGQPTHALHGPAELPGTAEGTSVATATPPTVDAPDVASMARQLSDGVLEAVRTGTETLRLVLNPPELGHLAIRMQQTDGGLRVHLATATAEARDAIERALPALVSGLEARSIRVEHAEVRHASSTDASRWNDQGANARQRGDGNDRHAWERPDWSGMAALEGAGPLRTRARDVEQLLDVVA
ncbi:MAG: flagellar hook-length control protein FliK [Dehalococcoidia bacterium]